MFISCSILGGLRANVDDASYVAYQLQTLTRIRDAGYDCVELYYDNRNDWVGDIIIRSLELLQLRAYSIHLPKFLLSYDEDSFHSNIKTILPFIQSTGVEVAVLHPPDDELLRTQEWKMYFEELYESCQRIDCCLTFEIVPYLSNIEQFFLEQLELYSNLGITVDLEFLHLSGLTIESILVKLGNSIYNIHFRDSDGELVDSEGKRKYLLPGTGEIQMEHVIKQLSDYGYDKAITIEVSHRQRENIVLAKEYAEKCIRAVGEPKKNSPNHKVIKQNE